MRASAPEVCSREKPSAGPEVGFNTLVEGNGALEVGKAVYHDRLVEVIRRYGRCA